MKTLIVILGVCVLLGMLLQVGPSLAQGPDHRPEAWEQTATAAAGGGETQEPARPPRATATATMQPYPMETPDPYPMAEKSGGLFEWLRRLLWKVE